MKRKTLPLLRQDSTKTIIKLEPALILMARNISREYGRAEDSGYDLLCANSDSRAH
jgi:hypothetical protein